MQKQSIASFVLIVVTSIVYTSAASAIATLEVKNSSTSKTQAIELHAVQPEPMNNNLEPGAQLAPSQLKVLPLPDTTKPELNTGEDAKSVDAFIKLDGIDGEAKVNVGVNSEEGTKSVSGYVKLDGIDGESEDKKEAKSLLWGNTQDPSTAAKKQKEIVVIGSKTTNKNSLKGKKILKNFKPAKAVLTSEDLQDYAEGIAEKDKNIKKVVLNNKEIKLNYKQPVKLFGFIPINMSISSSVDKQGAVKVKFPWYNFLTKHSLGDLKSKIEIAVSEMNKVELIDSIAAEAEDTDSDNDGFEDPDEMAKLDKEASLDLQNVIQKQQQILQTMSNIMKTMHDTASGIIKNLE